MRDHRDEIPPDQRALLREIDMTMFRNRTFRIFPRNKERQKPVQTRIGKVGGSKAAKILRRQQ